MPGDPHFSFDRLISLLILYLTDQKETHSGHYNLTKKCFFHQHASKTFAHRGHLVFAKTGFTCFLA